MRIVTAGAAALLALSFLTSSTAQEAKPAPEFRLRKPAAAKPEVQAWKGREVLRNGGFDYGISAWALNGGIATASANAGRSGTEGDLGAAVLVNAALNNNGLLCQMLHLPGKVTAGTLNMDWRITAQGQEPTLQQLAFAIGSFNAQSAFEPAAAIKTVTAANFPGYGWQKLEHTLTADELKAVNTQLGAKRQLVLIATIAGESVQLEADNASLKVDGEFAPAATPGCLAWAETIAAKERDTLEIVCGSASGGPRETMFRTHGTALGCYGLAWRRDGAELCFSANHEMAYSYFSGDVYALNDGGLRRVTNPPGRDEIQRDQRKTGNVRLKVRNLLFENVQGCVYVDGARKLGFFSLGPTRSGSDEAEVLVEEVVDYGDQLQTVIVRVGGKSALSGVLVDVKAGETATPSGAVSVDATLQDINALSPCYSKDGKRIVFARGSFFTVDAAGGVPEGSAYGTLIGSDPAISPVDDSLVYVGINGGLWQLKPGANQATELIKGDRMFFPEDPVWLGDGSGLLFTTRTTNAAGWGGRNMAAWVAQTGQLVQLTDLLNEDIESPTVSPDGQWLAGVRVLTGNGKTLRELWVWKSGEPQTCWRVETRGTPAHPSWCPK
ncbi:MAG: PD40 domain-containing protein [Planctomycetes bacterium]|nr:PD40 domain-containing protein [Planctomycetota bacterium]